ncbi:ORF2 [Dioscorea nummularia-associated virus]|uniref:ORF2 n=1 Tax=Dioscorea nummularia-associated virus TaxID=2303485 RepID=A0A346RP33_9VIRU|nr:ORF2 [Dioscorea nummularia-associated virus]AXS67830.1 ORF2 [Dioscorea nummularia-associated virus]
MSTEDLELKLTLEKLSKTEFTPTQGFTKEVSQSNLIRQHNTIIELLLTLHQKVDKLTQNVKQIQIKEAELSSVVKNLQTKNSTEEKPVVKTSPKVFAVWEDPKLQVEAYKRKYGQQVYSHTSHKGHN